jgi:hypothetical protein
LPSCPWTDQVRIVFLELVLRLRALTLELLPVEVDPNSINEPTSRIITPQVIAAYRASAGDFVEAVSVHVIPMIFCLFLYTYC